MDRDPQVVGRAVAARDAATRRVRRLTGAAVAVAAALTGIFAALAAGSTPPRKTVTVQQPARSTPVHGRVTAPAPPLVPAQAAPASPPPAAAPPVQAPGPAPQATPPVVVSGGS